MADEQEKEKSLIQTAWNLLEPVVRSEGMELIEIEYRREPQGWVLRLYIDQETGITLDDCTRISAVVGDLLDVADFIHNPYHLEVSSPGLDRPLRKWQHFSKYIGMIIDVRSAVLPTTSRRKYKGRLVAVSPEIISLDCSGQLFEIPLQLLERARLCYFESQGWHPPANRRLD